MATVESPGLIHDAFVYASEEEFLAGTLPFLEEGIDRGEPILAAPTHANAQLLRDGLGRGAKGGRLG
ncbi:MAG TPA: MEDS domain-containing protein [Gaiellaceae bacterium]|nr:MEDS domain-containing protein [Gaiellaceae bacterium]